MGRELLEMIENTPNCIGLAAPHIGYTIRMIGINLGEGEIFFNPVLTNPSLEKVSIEEGSVSLPGVTKMIERPSEIDIQYLDTHGVPHTERLTGMRARVVQHEYDHLDGIIFTDHPL